VSGPVSLRAARITKAGRCRAKKISPTRFIRARYARSNAEIVRGRMR